MKRPASMWRHTVEDRGIESAVVDKYHDLFAADPVLQKAWAQMQSAEAAINTRMDELALAERAAQAQGESK